MMANLSIITLNVNGIRAEKKRLVLFDFLKSSSFDVMFLQEAHIATVEDCIRWNRESGFKGYWSLGATNSCGVGILLRDHSRFKNCSFRCDSDGRIVTFDCTFQKQDFRFLSVYVPTDGSQRIEFFQNFDRHLVTRRRIIMGGDFNCMFDLDKDKLGGNSTLGSTGVPHLKKLLTRFSLVDVWRKQHTNDRQFTWQNKFGTIKCRLDKFYVTSSLLKDFLVDSEIIAYPYSDHDLVRVSLNVVQSSNNIGPGVWKLNVSLLNEQCVREKVVAFWREWQNKKQFFSNIGEWWDTGKSRVKLILMSCGRKISRKKTQERARLLNTYRRLVARAPLSSSDAEELEQVKSQLMTLDYQRIRGNQLRSKAKWIETNEQPSRFFFQKERQRAVKKTCQALRTKDGRKVTDQVGIMAEQVRFYKELYSKVPTDSKAQDRLLNLLDRKLTEEQRDSCEGLVTEAECYVALKSLSAGKTPGSDGLPKEFYVTFWDLLKQDFVEMVNECDTMGIMPESLRQALISLLYKKDDPELLKNWRPISLLNVDYKIFTKVLVQRIKPLMSVVVHPDQCCAVPGRSSEDNAFLLRDICDYLDVRERAACAFISIDQEKAFDSVDWEFLDRVLLTMNFGPKFRSIVKCCYNNIQSAILSNGYPSEFFEVERGVRQGCPLSPLLFVLVAEVFGQAIRKSPEVQGLRLPGGKEVKISQYADDNTCVVTNTYGIFKVIDIFNEYGRASGARLNTSKSKGLWLGRWRSRTDSPCGLTWVNTSLKIVGLHFGSDDAQIASWKDVSAKFSGVIKKWESRFLTLRGKATVLNSLAASTLWHVAKIYPPSREMMDSLQSQIWKFVWSRKPELVRRETCISDHQHGGLRIIDLQMKSKALLISRVFRFLDASKEVCSWQCLMRFYVGRSLGINDNTRPNCDIPTPFYSHLLRVLREFDVVLSRPKTSKAYYDERVRNSVSPMQARCEVDWNRHFGPGLVWKNVWQEVSSSWNDPLLRDFDWRTIHRVIPVSSRMHRWNSHIPASCARCGARVETLEHALVYCPMIADMWNFILQLCHRIDATVVGLSERQLFFGGFLKKGTRDLLRYLISVGKFSAWKERVSYQFKKDEKINCLFYFKNYVRNRLRMEQCFLTLEQFECKWCIKSVLARVTADNVSIYI